MCRGLGRIRGGKKSRAFAPETVRRVDDETAPDQEAGMQPHGVERLVVEPQAEQKLVGRCDVH